MAQRISGSGREEKRRVEEREDFHEGVLTVLVEVGGGTHKHINNINSEVVIITNIQIATYLNRKKALYSLHIKHVKGTSHLSQNLGCIFVTDRH